MLKRTLDQRRAVYHGAIGKFGEKAQLVVAIEEVAELQVEIAKLLNGKRSGKAELIDELADARLVIEQIEFMFGLSDTVEDRLDLKISKLELYLD